MDAFYAKVVSPEHNGAAFFAVCRGKVKQLHVKCTLCNIILLWLRALISLLLSVYIRVPMIVHSVGQRRT